MKPKIYILSGLGADERVFQLLDLSAFDVVFIQWIKPEVKESIQDYAARLLRQIKTENPIIIGLSFGGMMAVELSKLITTQKIILLSSAKGKNEIPFYLKIMGSLGLDRIVPAWVLKQSNSIVNWFFGVSGDFEKDLLKQILKDMEPVFLKWAIHQVLNWQNEFVPQNMIHIHGTNDKLLPFRYVTADYVVRGGGHFMLLHQHQEVSKYLVAILR